ncbi:NADH-FMN oxidoreductase RutF, flavin reductase (DIM6/NTAB) family [Klenkia soli]|uniref:NADH-FMN oxidoreductase RutF, flavin reductase (DIM6/NTAB) family n=1 Tax=Klenkia soli TaxID=1052260 RepID=A0A1H0LNT8_9ACTN|nr:NADH-FMN oxidoreductase RutF, flavin reductase (DIM6/NTAB) family [Klenkia soli]
MVAVTAAVAPQDLRRALGLHATGVAVVTATEADGGTAAMVVGTFTSVSLDPPLVGFLPDRSSSSWPRIAATGGFRVSVLAADQEPVCRAFATKAEGRFDLLDPVEPGTAGRAVRGAVLTVDCTVHDVLDAGDHHLVLGAVRSLAPGAGGRLPLLFVRGGYGAPSVPSVQAEVPAWAAQLAWADRVRPEAEALAAATHLECLVTAAVDGRVVSLVAAGVESRAAGSATRVGTSFPLVAPLAPVFVAWAPEAEQRAWADRARALTGGGHDDALAAQLHAVRERGVHVTTGHATADAFERVVRGEEADGLAPVLRALLDTGPLPVAEEPVAELVDVTSLTAPVRDAGGRVVLALHLSGFTGTEPGWEIGRAVTELHAAAARCSLLLGR